MFGVSVHSLLTHFPITLAIVACGYDGWAVWTRNARLHGVGSGLIKLAALGAVAATGAGFDLAGVSGLGSSSSVTGHAGLALLTTLVLVSTAVIRYSAETRSDTPEEVFSMAFLVAEVSAALLVVATAIMGHKI
jgi:uncharacterized membrane protein